MRTSSWPNKKGKKSLKLEAWLRAEGAFVHPSLELVSSRGGVVSRGFISRGELLLRVPRSACLIAENPEELSKLLEGGPAAYVATLPENPDAVGFWSKKERALLRGTSIDRAPRATRELAIVKSRAVETRDGLWALVPGVDALNDWRGINAPATSLFEEEGFVMAAERDVRDGEEVTHAYDDEATPADLVLRYGFCSLEALPAPHLLGPDDLPKDRGCLLARSKGWVAMTTRDPLPDELLGVFVLDAMSEADVAMAIGVTGGDLRTLDFWAACEDPSLADTVASSLLALARTNLAKFAPDHAFADDTITPRRRRAADTLRNAERAPLLALVDVVHARFRCLSRSSKRASAGASTPSSSSSSSSSEATVPTYRRYP